MKLLNNIYDLLNNFVIDLSSIRIQLIYGSFILNMAVLYGVIFHGIDYKILTITFASQMVLYHFYFQSKMAEHAADDTSTDDTK